LIREINKTLGLGGDDEAEELAMLDEELEIDYKIYRLEKLLERRPILLK